jgi:hypothetical protein
MPRGKRTPCLSGCKAVSAFAIIALRSYNPPVQLGQSPITPTNNDNSPTEKNQVIIGEMLSSDLSLLLFKYYLLDLAKVSDIVEGTNEENNAAEHRKDREKLKCGKEIVSV